MCIRHFCSSSVVYEPIVIVSAQRLLAFFAGVLIFAREFFSHLFVYCHIGNSYVARIVTNEFSTNYKHFGKYVVLARPPFCFYQIAAYNSAGSVTCTEFLAMGRNKQEVKFDSRLHVSTSISVFFNSDVYW